MRTGLAPALLLLGVLLAACSAAPAEDQGRPVVHVVATGDGNTVAALPSGGGLAVDVWSPRGIGAATLTLAAGPAPEAVELRLHLRGLEELRVASGERTTLISVASGEGHAVTQRLLAPDGAERPLAPGDPAWLPVSVVGTPPERPFPLEGGHFSVTLPAGAMAEGDVALSIQWVDFFR